MKTDCISMKLFEKYNGTILEYNKLPQCAKNTVDIYYKDEFEIEISNDDTFGFVNIPVEELKSSLDIFLKENDYNNFEEYHKWYLDGGDIPNHDDVWAIILTSNDDEVIFDGWHRFHSYIKKGIKNIPAIFPIKIKQFN